VHKGFLIAILAAMAAMASWGRELVLDESFRPPVFERYGTVTLAAPTIEGKVIIAGIFTSVGSVRRHHLARVLFDGRVDLSFDAGEVGFVDGLVSLPDGRVLFGGSIRLPGGETRSGVFRLLKNGALDPTFVGALPGNSRGYRMELAPGGKVYVQIEPEPRMVRLNLDGTVDQSFQTATGFDNAIFAMAIQKDGRLLVGGFFDNYDGVPCPKLARLNPNGRLDPTFRSGLNLTPYNYVSAVEVRGDGKIYVGGQLEFFYVGNSHGGPSPYRNRGLALLESNGALDRRFSILVNSEVGVNSLSALPNGDLLVQGSFTEINFRRCGGMARINSSGAIQPIAGGDYTGLTMFSNDKSSVLLCGVSAESRQPSRVVRLSADGREDARFRVMVSDPAIPENLALCPDGKYLASGDFHLVNGVPTYGAVRLKADGSRDMSFKIAIWPDGPIHCMAPLTNGQILVGGRFSKFNGQRAVSVCRLTSDGRFAGTMKTPFYVPPPAPAHPNYWERYYPFPWVDKFVRTGDGRVLALGVFNVDENNQLRFNADGSEDSSFGISSALLVGEFPEEDFFEFTPESLLPLKDGGFLVAGFFGFCHGFDAPCWFGGRYVVRINALGALNSTFGVVGRETRFNTWGLLAEQSDERFLVSIKTESGARVYRLLRTGAADESFRSVEFGPGVINKAITLNDDSVLVGGEFQSVDGKARKWMARILKDGGFDESFDVGDALDGPVGDLIPQKDGSWVVHGSFDHVNGVARPGLARVRW